MNLRVNTDLATLLSVLDPAPPDLDGIERTLKGWLDSNLTPDCFRWERGGDDRDGYVTVSIRIGTLAYAITALRWHEGDALTCSVTARARGMTSSRVRSTSIRSPISSPRSCATPPG